MVNLEWYRTFKAIYQTRSLTAASKLLFISQPNVSQHLTALESHIGHLLFIRKPKLVPTEYGKTFYSQLVEPLEKLENLEAKCRTIDLSNPFPLLRIGTLKEYFHTVLTKNLLNIQANFNVSFGLTKELITRLMKEELDFVIATQRIANTDIIYEPIYTEKFIIVGNSALDTLEFDQFIKLKEWTKAEQWLLRQNWFAYSADLAVIRRFWLNNFKNRPAVKPRIILPDMHTILQIMSNGEGIAITADYTSEEAVETKKIKEIWKGNFPSENVLYLAYDQKKVTADQVKAARKLVQLE